MADEKKYSVALVVQQHVAAGIDGQGVRVGQVEDRGSAGRNIDGVGLAPENGCDFHHVAVELGDDQRWEYVEAGPIKSGIGGGHDDLAADHAHVIEAAAVSRGGK